MPEKMLLLSLEKMFIGIYKHFSLYAFIGETRKMISESVQSYLGVIRSSVMKIIVVGGTG